MNRTSQVITAALLTSLILLGLVLSVSAGFISISLTERAVYDGTNWNWSGTANVSNPHHYVCIHFPGTSVSPVACSGHTSGSTSFSCVVPATSFNGVSGSVNWAIYANNQSGCTGPQSASPPGDPNLYSGTLNPTAVSLADFQANAAGNPTLWVMLPALALVLGAAFYFLFRRLKVAH